MTRRFLTDEIWLQIQKTMQSKGCYDTKDSRDIMEAIIWKLRTGAPWRDLPSEFCPWKTTYNRFNRWAQKGLWEDFFFKLRGEIDSERIFVDGSCIRAHQHASGARIGEERAIGKSRGGLTTKIHMAADAHGHPIYFEITGGEVHDSRAAKPMIQMLSVIKKCDLLVPYPLFQCDIIARRKTMNLIPLYISSVISLRIFLLGSSIFVVFLQDLRS